MQHYGWKMGVPFYALGVYAGVSRITAEKHWASDVVFGAAVGVASGYTVTRRFHSHPVTLSPAIYQGGVGVAVNLQP
jgi:membrane-associated phospholipid phosphatase